MLTELEGNIHIERFKNRLRDLETWMGDRLRDTETWGGDSERETH